MSGRNGTTRSGARISGGRGRDGRASALPGVGSHPLGPAGEVAAKSSLSGEHLLGFGFSDRSVLGARAHAPLQ